MKIKHFYSPSDLKYVLLNLRDYFIYQYTIALLQGNNA